MMIPILFLPGRPAVHSVTDTRCNSESGFSQAFDNGSLSQQMCGTNCHEMHIVRFRLQLCSDRPDHLGIPPDQQCVNEQSLQILGHFRPIHFLQQILLQCFTVSGRIEFDELFPAD